MPDHRRGQERPSFDAAATRRGVGVVAARVEDEERHADFLESQLHDIKELGIANYLSQQMDKETSD